MSPRIVFVVPGKLEQLTGGYLFDRCIVEGLSKQGLSVEVAELSGKFPQVDCNAVTAAQALVDSLSSATVLVIDGLALPAFKTLLPTKQGNTVIGFIHHPLSLETGLTQNQASDLAHLEAVLWASLDGVICASPSTARFVVASGVEIKRVQVASPGVELSSSALADLPTGTGKDELRLLCIATVTQRKGHIVLANALAELRQYPWTLDCYGSLERDSATVSSLFRRIQELELIDRIRFNGEQTSSRLFKAYTEADLFVLPSYYEGYGMVLTEAISFGLPIVSTSVGAIPETVPAAASILVPPGDVHALAVALRELLEDRAKLNNMHKAALEARLSLVSWPDAIDRWYEALNQCLSLGRVAV